MYKIVLVRHGESVWNEENKFTGWADVDLTEKGIQEAHRAAKELLKAGFTFDIAFTSYLKRAVKTLNLILENMDLLWIPVEKAWQLNERHYGALQGLNKSEMASQYGEEQILMWRRSYSIKPPTLEKNDTRYPGLESKYQGIDATLLPYTESLKETVERVLPYFEREIVPFIKKNQKVLIVAHGNSLRALIKELENMSEEDILKINVPTGVPLVYELDEHLRVQKKYYLGDQQEIESALNNVSNQGKKN